MIEARACAKVNLALVVGPLRADGKHEVVTVYQRVELSDDVSLEPATALSVTGFPDDAMVTAALESLAAEARVAPDWHVRITKRIPVAAGLGGGSSDAAAALLLANSVLDEPLGRERLHGLASALGADVPFFLTDRPQLGAGDGTVLQELDLPQGYGVLLVLPHGERKESTASVYRAFDERGGEAGFEERRRELLEVLDGVRTVDDLARLPRNDLASSRLSSRLEALGALRSDVSGAGPAVYGLFGTADGAAAAAEAVADAGATFVTTACC